MSFSFNFALGDGTPAAPAAATTPPAASVAMRNGERFIYSPGTESAAFSAVQVGDATYEIVNTTDAGFLARTGAISAILTTSDVQTGVYEGGFKLWECAVDLVCFVETQLRQGQAAMPASVLELGCGHGLPGIHALQRGAKRVVFSDYNKEVLELTTCPNVLRNAAPLYEHAAFYAGAWSSMSRFMADAEHLAEEEMQFDLILTAETIYTETVAVELYQVSGTVR
jgi:SAM-dependent methyltransferase